MGKGFLLVWDRPGGVARDRELQGHKHAAQMLQACGLGSSQSRRPNGMVLTQTGVPDHASQLNIIRGLLAQASRVITRMALFLHVNPCAR